MVPKSIVILMLLLPIHWTRGWNPSFVLGRRRLLVETAGSFLVVSTLAHPSNADSDECDEACREKRLQVILERRAMMQQSRSTSSRQEVFDLSKQRAALYNTTYQGANCPPGVPCL